MDIIHKVGIQSADDPFKFVMSTESTDRDGDVIMQRGWNLTDFRKNPIALFQHNSNLPIGTWTDVKVEDGRLVGHLKMAAKGTSKLVDEVRSLLEQRILRAVSVGFVAQKSEPLNPEEKNPWGPQRFLKQLLLECSIVSIPSNQEALMSRAKGLGIRPETLELLRGTNGVPASPRSASRGLSASPSKVQTKGKPMSLAKRIKALQESLDHSKGVLSKLVEQDDLNEDEEVQLDAITEEIAANTKTLESLLKAERALTGTPVKSPNHTPTPNGAPRRAAASVRADRKGDLLVRAAAVKCIAHVQKRTVDDVLMERYGYDERLDALKFALNVKADANVATTVDAGWAAELVSNDTRGWVEDLEAVSVFAALAGMGTTFAFGDSNSVTVPSRDRAKKVGGSWVGQNATIPVKDGAFTSITLNRFKKAVISVFTEELAQTSNPQIEAVLRDIMRTDTAESMDVDLLDATAGVAAVRPASILNGQPTQASAGDTLDNIHTDIRYLLNALSAVNAGRNPAWIMNPARVSGLALMTNATGAYVFKSEITQGTLMGYPLISSTNVPADIVALTDAADFSTAVSTPEMRVSDQATLVMLDDDGVDPTMAGTNAVTIAGSVRVDQAAGVTGGPAQVRSMFQQYSTALRAIYPVSWAMMRAGTSPYLTGVSW